MARVPAFEDRTCCTHPGTGICMCDCHDWEHYADDYLVPQLRPHAGVCV